MSRIFKDHVLKSDIYQARLVVNRNGKTSTHPAGRFMVHDGKVSHLEDYHDGLLAKTIPAGHVDDYTEHKVGAPGPDLTVASNSDIAQGKRLDFVPEHPLAELLQEAPEVTPEMIQQHAQQRPAGVWQYKRVGHDSSHTLQSHGKDRFTLDGNPLAPEEVQTILGNIRSKVASLRYRPHAASDLVAKMELRFEALSKADMHPDEAFRHLQSAVDAGHIPSSAMAALRKQVYEDPMVPGLGNKYAFNEFHQKEAPGVYISGDSNDFKAINDTHGHEVGDSAIKAYGNAFRSAMDETVGNDQSKAFRNGGDEFVGHVPTHEHAATFSRALRSKLDAIPPIGGTHKLSMSLGFGPSFHSADKALLSAKTQKFDPNGQRKFPVGQTPSFAHSNMPGFEGPVPLDQTQFPPIKMPPAPKVKEPKPAAAPVA